MAPPSAVSACLDGSHQAYGEYNSRLVDGDGLPALNQPYRPTIFVLSKQYSVVKVRQDRNGALFVRYSGLFIVRAE